jgi:hypothetical protein
MSVVDPGLPPWLLPNDFHMSHKAAAPPCLHAHAGVLWAPKACGSCNMEVAAPLRRRVVPDVSWCLRPELGASSEAL